jgi:hypothetical protein
MVVLFDLDTPNLSSPVGVVQCCSAVEIVSGRSKNLDSSVERFSMQGVVVLREPTSQSNSLKALLLFASADWFVFLVV